MPFQLQINDTSKMNKPLWKTIIDGLFVGRLMSLKWKEFNLFRTIISTLTYTVTDQTVTTLKEAEIRLIDDSLIVRGKLCSYYQLFFPFLQNLPDEMQIATFQKYTDFLDNIATYSNLEIFYYDRQESLSDYSYYFDQLDAKKSTFKFFSENGSELAYRLREELPDLLSEIISTNKSRVREAFLIISVDCNGRTIEDIDKAKEQLQNKINKVCVSLQEIEIDFLKVESEHRDWFLTNFVSHTVQY